MPPLKIVYVLSEIDKALAFEWIAELLDSERFLLKFILLNAGPGQLESFLRGRGVEVVRIRFRGKQDMLAALCRMWSLFREWAPEIVHCHLLDATRLGLLAAWFARVPRRIYTRHHSSLHFRYHPKGVWFDRLGNALATQVVAICECVREILTRWEGLPAPKVVNIYHGFQWSEFRRPDLETLQMNRVKFGLSGRYPVVGAVGRFVDWKGFQYLIPGFASILSDYPEAVLLMPQDQGPFRFEIERLLSQIPAKNYRLIPHQASPGALFNLFDLFVHAPIDAHIEAFGQIYVEALAAGLPSIFTLSGIAREIAKDGDNCLVVPFQDAVSIGAALRRLLVDSELRKRLIKNAFPSVRERFSLDQHIACLETLYQATP